ncbi:unnamed protein product [Microthlaspi erraticum]|uniref:CCHC-type domain-containing protein n=1 Tax=Microthlaspi erraticum TaxID=1685480 RepID=A0A6D2HNY9_9BRAS|nr:unnamed protein product [Microthlaspi erraticum]CAA7050353.1 unnamed protein product [Microthlaspi erraticum]
MIEGGLTRGILKDSRQKKNSRSRSKGKKVTCWYCKKEGHVKKYCFLRKKRMESDDDAEAAVAMDALNVQVDDSKESWVIDSDCTHHMTFRRDWFVDFSEEGSSKILLGDYHTVETLGIGSIRVNTHRGSVKVMHNVKYVPTLRRNLISTGTLDKLGFKHSGGGGEIIFRKGEKFALKGVLKGGLYILDGETITDEVCQAETPSTTITHPSGTTISVT